VAVSKGLHWSEKKQAVRSEMLFHVWWNSSSPLSMLPSLVCAVAGRRIFQHLGFVWYDSVFIFFFTWSSCFWHGVDITLVSSVTMEISCWRELVAITVNNAAFSFVAFWGFFSHFSHGFSSLPVSYLIASLQLY